MIRKSSVVVVAAAGVIAAAAAFALNSHAPAPMPKVDTGYGYHTTRHVNRHVLDGCFSEPVECGLVVW